MIQETIKFRISRHLNVKFVLMMKIRERVMLYNVGIVLVQFVGELTSRRKSRKTGRAAKFNVYLINVMLSSTRKQSSFLWTVKFSRGRLPSNHTDTGYRYVTLLNRAYVDDNDFLKWCPAPNCEYAVECHVPVSQLDHV